MDILYYGVAAEEKAITKGRYTHSPNPCLAARRSQSQGSTEIRKARIDDGAAFVEPVAKSFNDQFPWG